ncbi:MAG: DUF3194 domain-containing protein [Candidatus Methanomethylicia archaeon]
MVKRATELSDDEIANIASKAYDAIINFISEHIGVNNAVNIDVSIEVLRNDELTFDVSVDINLGWSMNVNINNIIDESISMGFQVIDRELSKILKGS